MSTIDLAETRNNTALPRLAVMVAKSGALLAAQLQIIIKQTRGFGSAPIFAAFGGQSSRFPLELQAN